MAWLLLIHRALLFAPNAQTHGRRAGAGGETPLKYSPKNKYAFRLPPPKSFSSVIYCCMPRPIRPENINRPALVLKRQIKPANLYQLSDMTGVGYSLLKSACCGDRELGPEALCKIWKNTGFVWDGMNWVSKSSIAPCEAYLIITTKRIHYAHDCLRIDQ